MGVAISGLLFEDASRDRVGHPGRGEQRAVDITPEQLVEAFIRPPTIAHVGFRDESSDGKVLIVSLVELWPWRTVVRGLRADRFADTSPTVVPSPADVPQSSTGVLTGTVRHAPDEQAIERRRAEATFYTGWHISDDAGTEYRSVAGGGGGRGGALWSDFHLEFEPSVPNRAQHLFITAQGGHEITVDLGT